MRDLAKWADYVYSLAVEAGEAILEYYDPQRPLTPQYKEDKSPLTVADQASHDIIYQGLTNFMIEGKIIPVLSEEGKQHPFTERQKWAQYWCVDPLDGTKDFLAHNDEFTVNIALIEDNRPVIGIIYVPAQKCGYMAWKQGGAYRCDRQGNKTPIKTQTPPHTLLKVLVSRYHVVDAVQPWLASLGETTLIQQGSALKFCTLASGQADVFLRLSPSSEWDNAAGQCILEEAGGEVFSWDMLPLTYNRCGNLEQHRFIAVGDKSYHWEKHFKKS